MNKCVQKYLEKIRDAIVNDAEGNSAKLPAGCRWVYDGGETVGHRDVQVEIEKVRTLCGTTAGLPQPFPKNNPILIMGIEELEPILPKKTPFGKK